jgi:hypothetical protein
MMRCLSNKAKQCASSFCLELSKISANE